MAERLEIDIKQSITVNDQTKGTEAKPSTTSPQAPSVPVQPSTTPSQQQPQAVPPTPEAVKTVEAQAVGAESATPEFQPSKPKPTTSETVAQPEVSTSQEKPDILTRAAKTMRQLEERGVPFEEWKPWLQRLKRRYMPEAMPTAEAEAFKPKVQKRLFEEPEEPEKPTEQQPTSQPKVVEPKESEQPEEPEEEKPKKPKLKKPRKRKVEEEQPEAVETEPAEAIKPKRESKPSEPEKPAEPEVGTVEPTKAEVKPPEAVKPPGPEIVPTPGEPPIAAPVGEAVTTGAEAAVTGAAETAVTGAVEAGVETAAVTGAEATGTVVGEVAGAAGGAGGGAGVGAAVGTAMAPGPGTAAGAVIGALGGMAAGQALGVAFKELVETVKSVDKALLQMSKDAAQYNAAVAGAQATAELRDTMAQIKRAEKLGPQLAEFTDVRSQFSTDLQDAMTNVAGPIADLLTVLVEVGRDIMDIVLPLTEAFNSFYEWIKDSLGGLPDVIKAILSWFGIDKRDRDEKRAKEAGEFLKDIEDFLNPVLFTGSFMEDGKEKKDYVPRSGKGF